MAFNKQQPPAEYEECMAETSPLKVTVDLLMYPSWGLVLVSVETTETVKELRMWSLGGNQQCSFSPLWLLTHNVTN